MRGRDKGAAGREFGCWSQTADHACCISQWATAGRWYVFSSQYALNIIPGPHMHMDIWLWEYVVGCAYLCVRVLHMRMILILCVLCECVCVSSCVCLGVKTHPSSDTSPFHLQSVYQWVKPHYQAEAGPSHSRLLNHNELLTAANLSSQINHPNPHMHTHTHTSPLDLFWMHTYFH